MLRYHAITFVGLCFLLIGCETGPTYHAVKGRVTFEGAPVESGLVEFHAPDGTRPTAKGGKITNGEYAAEVPAGDVIVKISAYKVIGKRKMYEESPDSPTTDIVEQYIPKKYNEETTLKEKITARQDNLDFRLTK